jgi:hypothetical protein
MPKLALTALFTLASARTESEIPATENASHEAELSLIVQKNPHNKNCFHSFVDGAHGPSKL